MSDGKEAFENIVFYNGYEAIVKQWVDALNLVTAFSPHLMDFISGYSPEGVAQIECLNIMLVTWFGDYGTSPRSGWIENRKECAGFLLSVLDDIAGCESQELS